MRFFMSRFEEETLALLRFMAGFMFALHGAQKLLGAFGGMGGSGATAEPLTMMWFAGVLELIGGLLIAVGLLTRPVAFILSGMMAVAYFTAHLPDGFWPIQNGGELAALYCFLFLYLSARGPGRYSLDAVVFRKHMEADHRRPARL
jgi:putative oxidoreductase